MILLHQFRRFICSLSFVVLFATLVTLGVGTGASWATPPLTQIMGQPQAQIAAMNQVEAITKNIGGKAQEAIGNITGDPKDQLMGKAKQAESRARNTAADMKDKMALKGRAKAVTKNIEGKVQEASGKATGNRKDQVAGKVKQVESQARNTVEDVKNQMRDARN